MNRRKFINLPGGTAATAKTLGMTVPPMLRPGRRGYRMTCNLRSAAGFLEGASPVRLALIQDCALRPILYLDNALYVRRCGLGRPVAGTTMPNGTAVPPPAESSTEMRIANDMSEIARVAALVESFAARHNFPNSVVVALNVSLDEILNNIISYAYEDVGRHDIVISLKLRHGTIEVVVEDDGKPFDPLAVSTPRPQSAAAIGGVGLHFVRSLMDQLEYVHRDGINRLRLVKKLTA
jgi:serine/threonine-protein kinase RsbW